MYGEKFYNPTSLNSNHYEAPFPRERDAQSLFYAEEKLAQQERNYANSIEELRKQISRLRHEIDTANSLQQESSRGSIEAEERFNSNLKREKEYEIKNLKGRVEELQIFIHRGISENEAEEEILRTEQKISEEENFRMKRNLQSIRQEIEHLKFTSFETERRISYIQNEKKLLTDEHNEKVKKTQEENEKTIDGLKNNIRDNRNSIQNLTGKVEGLKKNFSANKEKSVRELKDLEENLRKLRDEKISLQEENEALRQEIQSSRQHSKILEDQNNKLQLKIWRTRNENFTLETEISRLEKKVYGRKTK